MSTGYWLLDHPNPNGPHYYTSRRNRIKAIVVHITAGLEDYTAPDDSAEATARNWASTAVKPVSWHSGSDSDSSLLLLPAGYTAFQCRGYNSSTYGHEISKAHSDWRTARSDWAKATINQAAACLGRIARANGIPFRHATKAELDHAIASDGPPVGFVSHAQLDPDRRRDPGIVVEHDEWVDTFPWGTFLAIAAGTSPPVLQEDDDMKILDCPGQRALLLQGDGVRYLTADQRAAYVDAGVRSELISYASWLLIVDHQQSPTVSSK